MAACWTGVLYLPMELHGILGGGYYNFNYVHIIIGQMSSLVRYIDWCCILTLCIYGATCIGSTGEGKVT